jgi:hypothetical protein
VEDGLLSCTRMRLLNRVESATDKHFRSHSRTRSFNSARTSGSCNSAVLSTHHRSARRRPAWLFFFLLLPSPHSPRPYRVAGPSATILAKVQPCATSLPFVRVCPELPRFTSARARPNRVRPWPASRCCSRV